MPRSVGPAPAAGDELVRLADLGGTMRYRGTFDPTTGRPSGAGVLAGDTYSASVAGYEDTGSQIVHIAPGDVIVALASDPTAAEWAHMRTAVGVPRYRVAPSSVPTPNADETFGYIAGSMQLDPTWSILYVCVDGADGAAEWRRLRLPPMTVQPAAPERADELYIDDDDDSGEMKRVTVGDIADLATSLAISKPSAGDYDLTVVECNTPTEVFVDGGTVGFDDFSSVAIGAWGIVTAVDAAGLTWDLTGLTTAQPSPDLTVAQGEAMFWHKTGATEVSILGGTSA